MYIEALQKISRGEFPQSRLQLAVRAALGVAFLAWLLVIL